MNDHDADRSLLAELIARSKVYHQSAEFKQLLDFTIGLRNFAPFNAFLLHLQKPGLRFAASEYDWRTRYNRTIAEGARPLIILIPFGPVALVYDIADTEGEPLPPVVMHSFRATGRITRERFARFAILMERKGINLKFIEYGDAHAGYIKRTASEQRPEVRKRSKSAKETPDYRVRVNKAHDPNVQFATLAHELAHLFVGHLGADAYLKIPRRDPVPPAQQELEAEAVSYLVCCRNGVSSEGESYLAGYVERHTTLGSVDIDAVLRAAGRIEALLQLTDHTRFGPKRRPRSRPHEENGAG
ncbi:MAG: ImmA/IrrE family metallo-endopeptidase [Pseudomonadota bacterium]|nr:ImmA/IrrE family metallo-endopeptidase [Pseudomonadota bacterium]